MYGKIKYILFIFLLFPVNSWSYDSIHSGATVDAAVTKVAGIEAGAEVNITDLDDLPGDTIDDDLIDSALVANFPDQSVDSGANPVLDGENFSNLQMDALVPPASTTQEILDSGDGNPATGSTTPNTSGYPETNDMTCSDSDTCAITMGETSIKDNQEYTIRNVGTNAITFADTAGVQELASSPRTLVQGESISFIYSTTLSAWTEKNKTNAVSFSALDVSGGTLEIPNGANPDVSGAAGRIANDTSDDQFIVRGASADIVFHPVHYYQAVVENLAAADDNYEIAMWNDAVTIISVGVHCRGTCSTPAQVSLEDRAGNAMTHTTPTASTGTGSTTFQSVTAANGLTAGEGLAFDVDNAVSPETDEYTITIGYTFDRQ